MVHSPCAFGGNGRLQGAGRELISQGALRPSFFDYEGCALRKQIANYLVGTGRDDEKKQMIAKCPLWVIFDQSSRFCSPDRVRFAPKAYRCGSALMSTRLL